MRQLPVLQPQVDQLPAAQTNQEDRVDSLKKMEKGSKRTHIDSPERRSIIFVLNRPLFINIQHQEQGGNALGNKQRGPAKKADILVPECQPSHTVNIKQDFYIVGSVSVRTVKIL